MKIALCVHGPNVDETSRPSATRTREAARFYSARNERRWVVLEVRQFFGHGRYCVLFVEANSLRRSPRAVCLVNRLRLIGGFEQVANLARHSFQLAGFVNDRSTQFRVIVRAP